jgi:integrase
MEWKSMWQRFTDQVLRETKVTERFTEQDLRAKCASDAESLEHARAMLAHADAKTTELIYRRRPERVRPARLMGQTAVDGTAKKNGLRGRLSSH